MSIRKLINQVENNGDYSQLSQHYNSLTYKYIQPKEWSELVILDQTITHKYSELQLKISQLSDRIQLLKSISPQSSAIYQLQHEKCILEDRLHSLSKIKEN
jgi:hypothetical protein